MFTFAVPDTHGRYDLFKEAIVRIDRYGKGKTVFLGDYCDRGPRSRQILEQLKKGRKDWIVLMGNHEEMMVYALRDKNYRWLWANNGGIQTLESFDNEIPKDMIDWIAKLPTYYEDEHRIFIHAGVNHKIPLNKTDNELALWERSLYGKYEDYFHMSGKYVVHGHTPLKDGPFIGEGRANFDCGAVWTNRLVIAVFDDDKPGKPVDTIEIKSFLKR